MITQCAGCGEWREIHFAYDNGNPECDDCADREESERLDREAAFYQQVDLPAIRTWINRNSR